MREIPPKKKPSNLDSLENNLIENDENDNIPEGKIKVGPTRYIKRADLAEIEKHKFITGRIDSLVELFYGKDLPHYSFSGTKKDGTTCFQVKLEEITSISTNLHHMKWSYKVDIADDQIKARISRCASAAYKNSQGKEDLLKEEKSTKKITSQKLVKGSKEKQEERDSFQLEEDASSQKRKNKRHHDSPKKIKCSSKDFDKAHKSDNDEVSSHSSDVSSSILENNTSIAVD